MPTSKRTLCMEQAPNSGTKEERLGTHSKAEQGAQSSTETCDGEVCQRECCRYDELIPGLPNDVSIEHISTKVPWGKLSSLSRSWRHAIDSGHVHEARIRMHSTQLYVAFIHLDPSAPLDRFDNQDNFQDILDPFDLALSSFVHDGNFEDILSPLDLVISLYSPSADTWHRLPLIPSIKTGIPPLSECLHLNGVLFVIGGCDAANGAMSSKQVYSINLRAWRPSWKRCADMLQPRRGFSSGVMRDKIYAFGGMGSTLDESLGASRHAEVYDPAKNTWSLLAPMLVSSEGDSPIVEEAYTLDGLFLLRCGFRDPHNPLKFVEIYNPEKDQWWRLDRDINTFGPGTFMMTVNGNFYFFERNNVIFYDFRTRSPSAQPNSLKLINESRALDNGHVLRAAPAGGGELLALHYWAHMPDGGGTILVKSKGLGNTKTYLQWECIHCSYDFDSKYTRMCVVEI